jgi:hypothetical protein
MRSFAGGIASLRNRPTGCWTIVIGTKYRTAHEPTSARQFRRADEGQVSLPCLAAAAQTHIESTLILDIVLIVLRDLALNDFRHTSRELASLISELRVLQKVNVDLGRGQAGMASAGHQFLQRGAKVHHLAILQMSERMKSEFWQRLFCPPAACITYAWGLRLASSVASLEACKG